MEDPVEEVPGGLCCAVLAVFGLGFFVFALYTLFHF